MKWAMPSWYQEGMAQDAAEAAHEYSDDDRNYLEEYRLMTPLYLERASSRLNGMFHRLKAEFRGVLKPLLYEAYLVKLEGVLGLLHQGKADDAEGRMSEIEAELLAELPYEGDPALHAYRDDEEDWADYGEGYERSLEDTAVRLQRLDKRLRSLKGTLAPTSTRCTRAGWPMPPSVSAGTAYERAAPPRRR